MKLSPQISNTRQLPKENAVYTLNTVYIYIYMQPAQ